ncbi:hypothetical protein CsSME_00006442 [Camellia sinensis var. sinensis]
MAGESLVQFSRRRNAKKMVARRKMATSKGNEEPQPVTETTQLEQVESAQTSFESITETCQSERRETSHRTFEVVEQPLKKTLRPSIDLLTPFVVHPKAEGSSIWSAPLQ